MREIPAPEQATTAGAVPLATGPGLEGERARWDRQAWRTTKARLIAQVVTYSARFLAIPLGLRLVGPERYGLWLASGSFLGWFGLAESGLGAGLVNALSEAAGRSDHAAMRRHVSTAVFALAGISLGLAACLWLFAQSPWALSVLGVAHRPGLHADARILTTVAAMAFALSLALSFVGPMCLGLQVGYLPALASAAGNLAVVFCLSVLYLTRASVGLFALGSALPPVLATAGLAWYLFCGPHRSLRPSPTRLATQSLRNLLGFGLPMLLGQIGEIAVFQSSSLLIANRLGPEQVPRYAVPYAMFIVVAQVCHAVYYPYWPAFTEASVRGDWNWLRTKALTILKANVAITLLGGAAIITAGRWFIRLWAGSAAVPDQVLLVFMAVYFLILATASLAGTLMWALQRVLQQSALTLCAGICQVVGFWFLSPSLGLAAIPIAGAVGLLSSAIISTSLVLREMRLRQGRTSSSERPAGLLLQR